VGLEHGPQGFDVLLERSGLRERRGEVPGVVAVGGGARASGFALAVLVGGVNAEALGDLVEGEVVAMDAEGGAVGAAGGLVGFVAGEEAAEGAEGAGVVVVGGHGGDESAVVNFVRASMGHATAQLQPAASTIASAFDRERKTSAILVMARSRCCGRTRQSASVKSCPASRLTEPRIARHARERCRDAIDGGHVAGILI
jgi:hypothetical protein